MRAALCLSIAAAGVFGTAVPASAHRDGCHRWHSCPSDTGSYVCGDLGYFSECGYSSLPDSKPETYDFEPPSKPKLKGPKAGPGGRVTLTVTAERGSRIEVRDEDDATAAKATATGSAQRLSFTGDDGEHTYTVVAIDAADNESEASEEFTLTVDADKPDLGRLTVGPTDPSTGLWEIRFTTEPNARYTVTVDGRKERLTGTASDDGEVVGKLALPNGTHRLTCAVRDEVGNKSHTEATATISLEKLQPQVRLSGTPDDGRALFQVSGPPHGKGALTVGGGQYPVTLDGDGQASVTAELEDGQYRAELAIRDPFGRKGSGRSASFTVDTTAPPLTVSYDTEQARYGDAVVTVTGETGTKVILDVAGTKKTVTLTGNRYVFRPRLAPGEHRLTVTGTDPFGNTTRRDVTLRISDEWTTGEAVRALLWTLGVLILLVLAGLLLWRRRRSVMGWIGRRREAVRVAAEERAARARAVREAAQARRRAEQAQRARQAYERALAAWQREHDQLAELHDLAANLRGEEAGTVDFPWGRRKAGERVLLVVPAQLVKIRTRQGQQYPDSAGAGRVAITDQRMLFTGGTTRHEWAYGKWLHHTHHERSAETMITVSNRQKPSGLRYALADGPRVRLVIDLALATSRSERSKIVEQTRQALAAHERHRPEAPAMT